MSHRLNDLLGSHLGPDWSDRVDEPGVWDCVLSLDDAALWAAHTELKRTLLRAIREDARRRWVDQWKEALHLVGAGTLLEERALTIGFARRFATYKRATLIFRDLDRLQRLLTNPWRPVQLIFSGKAHPADEPGKQMLQTVYAHTREARFEGRIAFLEDYEMHLAHRLVQGVDRWLNLPRPPLAASGGRSSDRLTRSDDWKGIGYDQPSAEIGCRARQTAPPGRRGPSPGAPRPHARGGADRRGPPDGRVLALRAHRRTGGGRQRPREPPSGRRYAHDRSAAVVPPGAGGGAVPGTRRAAAHRHPRRTHRNGLAVSRPRRRRATRF